MKITEQQIVKSILDYLVMKKVFHYRQNSGAFQTPSGGFYRMGVVGMPDIVVVKDGKYIGIEVKVPGKKQNPNQVEFQRQLEKAGGVYLLVTSVEEVVGYFI